MKNLKLLLALLACAVGFISAPQAAAYRATIYFQNNYNWGTPAPYVWNGGSNNSWDDCLKFVPAFKKNNTTYHIAVMDLDFTPVNIQSRNKDSDWEKTDTKTFYANALYDGSGNVTQNFSTSGYTAIYDKLYLRGSFANNWEANDNYALSHIGNGVYEGVVKGISNNSEFKIGDKDWKISYGAKTNMQSIGSGSSNIITEGNNMKWNAGTQEWRVSLNMFTGVLTVEEPSPAKLYIAGDVNGVDQWNKLITDISAEKASGNTYTFNLTISSDGQHRFRFTDGKKQISNQAGTGVTTLTTSQSGIATKYDSNDGCFEIANKGSYTLTVKYANGAYTLDFVNNGPVVNPDPVAGRTVYFDFGQDRSNKGDRNITPKICIWSSQQNSKDTRPAVKNLHDMYHSDAVDDYHDLWYYVVPEGTTAKDFSFCYYFNSDYKNQDGNGEFEYYTVGVGSSYNDMNNLYKYIYTTHGDHIAVQSYITFDQYIPLRQAEKSQVYVVGKGIKYEDKNFAWPSANSWHSDVVTIPAEHNVFYLPVKFNNDWVKANGTTGANGAAFKISWINPSDYTSDNKSDRLWATFNIGIVGYAKVRNEGYPATMTDAGDNWNVHCKTSTTYYINNHDQYNWFIPQSEATTDDYLLIVDLDDDCQSATLLSFTPHPVVNGADITIAPQSFDGDLLEHSTKLRAEAANGPVKYGMANMATATLSITTASVSDLLSNNYTAKYQLYSNHEKIGQPVSAVSGIQVTGLAIGAGATLGARAEFTDGKTGFKFHTKYNSNDFVVENDVLKAPVLEAVSNKTFTPGQAHLDKEVPAAERWYTLGAYATVPVTHTENPNNRAYYVDFQIECNAGTGGEIVHSDHDVLKGDNVHTMISALPGWTKHNGVDDYDDDTHNWSKALAKELAWPLHLADVVRIERDEDNIDKTGASATLTLKARYVYPFIIDRNAQIVVTTSDTPVVANAPARLSSERDWVLTLMNGPVNQINISLGDSELTAVRDLISDGSADAPAEYYNLQGVRVSGDLLPGVYIRRQGNKTEKMIIR